MTFFTEETTLVGGFAFTQISVNRDDRVVQDWANAFSSSPAFSLCLYRLFGLYEEEAVIIGAVSALVLVMSGGYTAHSFHSCLCLYYSQVLVGTRPWTKDFQYV